MTSSPFDIFCSSVNGFFVVLTVRRAHLGHAEAFTMSAPHLQEMYIFQALRFAALLVFFVQ